ncbi:hypothetical protein [Paenarthrobacter sp. YIM B13468]|uniref:hypothetical protein n=1 Tax=Paenarthrobacter sp. YIM B13468 TaxID=3366295 RepID=UPI003671B001
MTNSQARTGNSNAYGPNRAKKKKSDELPEWFKSARKRYGTAMTLHQSRGHYSKHNGKYIAAEGRVSIYMPADYRKIKDPTKPIVVNTPDGAFEVRDPLTAHAFAARATAKIHDAERARRLAAAPAPLLLSALHRASKPYRSTHD